MASLPSLAPSSCTGQSACNYRQVWVVPELPEHGLTQHALFHARLLLLTTVNLSVTDRAAAAATSPCPDTLSGAAARARRSADPSPAAVTVLPFTLPCPSACNWHGCVQVCLLLHFFYLSIFFSFPDFFWIEYFLIYSILLKLLAFRQIFIFLVAAVEFRQALLNLWSSHQHTMASHNLSRMLHLPFRPLC